MNNLKIIQWVARIWSLLSITFIVMFFVGEMFSDAGTLPTRIEWVGLIFFPIGILIGLLISWWHEGWGGTIGVLSFIAFYIWDWLKGGDFPRGPYFLLLALPCFLFLVYWWLLWPDRYQAHPSH